LKVYEKIGAGFYGEVYRGEYYSIEVALKKVVNKKDSTVKEFENEVRALRAIRHANVVRFIGICKKNDDEIYIVTEYISGGELKKLLLDLTKKLSWKMLISMLLDVANAMEYIHENNMLHRDLKSSNLLIAEDYSIKVADFGVSRFMDTSISSKGMTRPKMMTQCGTWCYMAPEVLRSEEYNEKVDIFSFGIVLVEAVTRKDAENIPRTSSFGVDFEQLTEFVPADCPEDLLNLMEECCAIQPHIRPSFATIVKRLSTLLKIYCVQESTLNNRSIFGIKH